MAQDSRVITFFPSGHAVAAEARETILQAGLRAGFNLDHHCATGTCGSCRARLVAGQLRLVQPHDFPFTEAQRAAGWFLMCRNQAASDVLVEAVEPGSAAEIPEQQLVARVARIERLQDEVVLLQLRTPRAGGLQFLAGQSVELCFEGLPPRSLPIASCPCDALHLRFHVRYRADDPFCELVFQGLRKGREVTLCGPMGDFTLDEVSQRPLLFVAWESGFARVQSLIDHAIQLDPERRMHLYWLSAIPQGHYLANYCRAWVDALDDFHYHSVDLAPTGPAALDAALRGIVQAHEPLRDWDLYLSLPQTAVAAAARLLDAAGLPAAQRHIVGQPHP